MGSDFYSLELIELGFKGLLLNRLLAYIVNAETMEKFKSFIVLNKLTGENDTNNVLVHKFVIKVQNENSFESYNQFLTQYQGVETHQHKYVLLEKLFAQYTKPLTLKKVAVIFDNNPDELESLYQRVLNHRGKYNPDEILTLLELTDW